MLPKVIGDKILIQLNAMDWQDPDQARFLQALQDDPASFPDADRQRLDRSRTADHRDGSAAGVPAFRDFLAKEYIPARLSKRGLASS